MEATAAYDRHRKMGLAEAEPSVEEHWLSRMQASVALILAQGPPPAAAAAAAATANVPAVLAVPPLDPGCLPEDQQGSLAWQRR